MTSAGPPPRSDRCRAATGSVSPPASGSRKRSAGSGWSSLPSVPVPPHIDQDLLRSRHAADHHDRAAPVAQERPSGHEQQRPRLTIEESGGGVADEGDGAAVEGGPDRGEFGRGEPLSGRPG